MRHTLREVKQGLLLRTRGNRSQSEVLAEAATQCDIWLHDGLMSPGEHRRTQQYLAFLLQNDRAAGK